MYVCDEREEKRKLKKKLNEARNEGYKNAEDISVENPTGRPGHVCKYTTKRDTR
jgi:hypothetical protein